MLQRGLQQRARDPDQRGTQRKGFGGVEVVVGTDIRHGSQFIDDVLVVGCLLRIRLGSLQFGDRVGVFRGLQRTLRNLDRPG